MPAEALELLITAQTQDVLSGLDKVEEKLDGVEREARQVTAAAKSTGGSFGGLGKSALGLAVKLGGIIGAAALVGKGFSSSGIKEQGEVQFRTLLGSAEAAQARMKELADFANATPFANEQVIQMSKTLQAMTGGALASGAGLRMVGDTAAALNPDELERFTMHIGRMFSQIKNGQAFGESLKELQEMGAITGDVAVELKKMQDAGVSSSVIWAKVQGELNKNKGAMAALSKTFSGSMSSVAGTFSDVLADAFRPITDALTPMLGGLTSGMNAMRPVLVGIGEKIAATISGIKNSVSFIFSVFKSGDIGALVAASLKLGGALFLNYMMGGLKFVVDVAMAAMIGSFSTIVDPAFWKGISSVWLGVHEIVLGIAAILIGTVIEAGQNFYGLIVGAVRTAGDIMTHGMLIAGAALHGVVLDAVAALIQVGQKLKLPGMDDLLVKVNALKTGTEAVGAHSKKFLSDGIPAAFEKNKQEASSFFQSTGESFKDAGKAMVAQGASFAAEGGKGLGRSLGENFGSAFDGVQFEPDNFIETEGLKNEFGDLVNKHLPEEMKDAEAETEESSDSIMEDVKSAIDPNAVASSLAKIGGGGNVFVAAVEAAGATGSGGGLTVGGLATGAAAGSSGLSGGATVGGPASGSVLESIDRKISEIIGLMSGPTAGGGLTVEVS